MAEIPTEGASPLNVLRHPVTDTSYVEIDSLVAMFHDMARPMPDGHPQKKLLLMLAERFEPMTTYESLQRAMTTTDDGVKMPGRRCGCGAIVVDGKRLSGSPVVIDAEPSDSGLLFPIALAGGVPTLAPYTQALDGVGDVVRLSEHRC